MATAGSNGKRLGLAIERLKQGCAAIGGGRELIFPTYSRYGADMLIILQVEAIADFIEGVKMPPVSAYESMTNKELTAEIEQRGLEKGTARSKSELIAVLEAAEKVNENATTS